MANIIQYLQDILSARYGKDVRQSIHDAIEEINNVNEANIGTVQAIADTAQGYANTALQAKTDAQTAQTGAETAQTNAETAEDGAEHWYNETLAISQTLANAIIARGTVAFADLPSVSSTAVKDGFMWNISDNFTTTSDFVEGAGINIPMGANVYKITINNVPKWDILAGSSAAVFVGTEAQIAQAEQQGLISENTMVISLDGEMSYELTSSMVLHGSESVENVLNQINSDLGSKSSASAVTGNDAFSKIATLKGELAWKLLGRISVGDNVPTQSGAREYLLECFTPYWVVSQVVRISNANNECSCYRISGKADGFNIEGGKLNQIWQDNLSYPEAYMNVYYR